MIKVQHPLTEKLAQTIKYKKATDWQTHDEGFAVLISETPHNQRCIGWVFKGLYCPSMECSCFDETCNMSNKPDVSYWFIKPLRKKGAEPLQKERTLQTREGGFIVEARYGKRLQAAHALVNYWACENYFDMIPEDQLVENIVEDINAGFVVSFKI